jgi:hypothetical protein
MRRRSGKPEADAACFDGERLVLADETEELWGDEAFSWTRELPSIGSIPTQRLVCRDPSRTNSLSMPALFTFLMPKGDH